jgi:hypothetical protein
MSEKSSPWAKVTGGELDPTWNPTKGVKKYEPSDGREDAYIMGYYLGSKEIDIPGNDKPSVLHTLKLDKVGNASDLNKEANEGDSVGFWGTAILNDEVNKNVSPGQMIMVKWNGKAEHSKKKDTYYHLWDLFVNTEVEPISVGGSNAS